MEERKTLCKEEFTNCEIVKENKQLQDKLKKIDKYCESTKEKYKYYNECNTTDVRVISKIIKGDD